jgi:hypothetical protein
VLKAKLQHIANYVLAQNTYFNSGYADVYKNTEGQILSGETPVFPADNLGDYFYLRLPNNVTFLTTPGLDDCTPGYDVRGEVTLVAVVTNADADALLHNLVNTMQRYGREVSLTRGVYQREVVILQELDKENAIRALGNLDIDTTIVSLSFNLVNNVSLNCITNPCQTC